MEFLPPIHYFDTLSQARKSYGKALEPVCQRWGLTRNEVDVLLFLYNNPGCDRAADIVRHRGIAKSHVSLSVSVLEHRHLLQRQFTAADRRTAHLALTEEGKIAAGEARSAQEQFFRSLFRGLTQEELAQWQKTVETVQKNIESF